MVTLLDQIAHLERLADEIGPTPELRAAIKTLRTIYRFEQPVRETLAKCIEATRHPAAAALLNEWPDVQVNVREVTPKSTEAP
jgi:glutamate synthase domain-containing protein 3